MPTTYFHPSDTNLTNLHKAMQYNAQGLPEVRVATSLDLGNVTVNIPDAISIDNFPAVQPVSGDVSIIGNVTTITPTGGTDAFGRLRVSQGETLADYSHVSGEEAGMVLVTNGGGSGNANVQYSSYTLGVGTASTDYAIHQSLMYHHYQPGKSQFILTSFVLESHRTNTTKRIGYFDETNGIFLEQTGTGLLRFVMRTNTGGTVNDEAVNQTSWNVDPCNGTGPSGFDLNVDKTQLMWIDFQWLGVGRVRVGFVHDGNFILANEFYHSNDLATVYWRLPSLPVRCEIRNTDVAVGVANIQQICATVISEGGYLETGTIGAVNSSLLGRTLVDGGDTMPVIAIRLKNSYNGQPNRGLVRIQEIAALVTDAPIYFEIRQFSSHNLITGGSWVSVGPDSIVEYNITATGYSGGNTVVGDFLAAAASKNTTASSTLVPTSTNKRGFISQNYWSNGSLAYALVATALGSTNNINAKVYGTLRWNETI